MSALALVAAACTGGEKAATPPAALAARLQIALDRGLRAPGASAAIAVKGKIVWAATSGVADLETRKALTTRTRFPIASVTKNLVAALALKLAEAGRLSLDEPIARWLPSFPRSERITVRHLLSHTAGLRDGRLIDHDPEAPWTAAELAPASVDPLCEVGTCKRYSSDGYLVAGLVIESATKQKLTDLLEEHLFEPLALRDTALVLDRVVGGDGVRPYDPSREPIGELGEAYLRGTWAAGGIVSTPSDLVRWSSALYRGRVLEPDSLREMLDAKPDTEASCRRWGCSGPHTLGTETVIYASRMTWGHEGSSGAVIRYFPEGEIAIAILTNQVPEGTPGPGPALDAIIRTLGLEERADLYSMRADGTSVTRLTEAPAVDGTPVAWSPDGQRILFGSGRDGNQEVYVMRADGTEERRLTTNAARDTGASWTHDGRIVFSSEREGPTRLYVMDSDGSNAQPLPGSAPGDAFPVVSPDGRRIAFATGPADNLDLVVMGLDGTQRTIVAGGPGSQWWASWSPDGSRIVFADETAEKFRIAVVGSDGSHRSFVPVESARWPAWSPNGRLIAFVRDKGDIVAVAPDGSGARVVARDPIWAFGPSWSPDGSQIAFASSRS